MNWNKQANSIFLDAIELASAEERCVFVERMCADQPELRREVLELLAAYQQAGQGDFLERAACSELPVRTSVEEQQDTCEVKNDSSVSAFKRAGYSPDAETPTLVEGTKFGRYRIEKILGRGGMGVVYLAVDTRLKRLVALKVPRFGDHPELIERFDREARTMAAVSHRNLCAIHDVDEIDGVRYLSLAFIEGETLAQVLERGEKLPPRRIAELMRKLALATARAHRVGVIHRDLKPANVIIDGEGEPVVMDFGVAHAVEEDARLTHSGCIMGTPAYMAPEQTLGDPGKVGTWSDIYSLGAVLYELLAGEPMFTGSASAVISKRMAELPPPQPRSVRADTDPALEAICLRATALRPEDRFESAAAMAAALEDYLEGRELRGVGREDEPHAKSDAFLYSRAVSSTNASRFDPKSLGLWLGPSLLSAVALAAVIVILLRSPEGTLVAEINDDSIVTQAQGQKLRIQDRQTNKEYELTLIGKSSTQSLPAGEYRIEVVEKKSGLTLNTDTFHITRDNMHPAVMVRFEPAETKVGPETKVATGGPSPHEQVPPSLIAHPLLSNAYQWSTPMNLGSGVNTDLAEDHACVSDDGLTMIFVRYQDKHHDIWQSRRSDQAEEFHSAERLPIGTNTPHREYTPCLSRDALTLWFASDRPGGLGGDDIYFSHRAAATDTFPDPINLGSPINSTDDETSPFLSRDGLTVFFARGAPRMLYQAHRASVDESFGEPQLLRNINSEEWNEFPRLFGDGLGMIYVSSHNGKQNLWLTTRESLDGDFQSVINLGPVINDTIVSGPSLSSDERTLFFSCRRLGGQGSFDLWAVTRTEKKHHAR